MAKTILVVLMFMLGMTYGRKMVDLTHTLDENAPKYPLSYFGLTNFTYYNVKTIAEEYIGDMWLALRTMEFYEHQGTHIDAPNHFGNGRQALNEIPTEKLIGPGVIIDIKDKARANPDYAVTVDDIKEHEAEHGLIPPNSIIIMNSGWGYKYPNHQLVFGTENITDPRSFRFPGWSIEACEMLLNERQVSVLGVDTPSTDPGQADEYYCHMLLQPNDVPLLEYVANLDSVPQRGTTIVLGTMKVRRGTGGPTRIFALIDDQDQTYFNSAETMAYQTLIVSCAVIIEYFVHKFLF
ncbi:hypothetical protein ACF0H5_000558 [Mactra antiquata]